MTRNLGIYILFSLLWSVGFFAILNWCLYSPDNRGWIIGLTATLYGIGFSIMGHYLGSRDSSRNTRTNLPLMYGFAASGDSLIIGAIWILLFENGGWVDFLAILAGNIFFLGIYAIISRKFVKGIPNKELFR